MSFLKRKVQLRPWPPRARTGVVEPTRLQLLLTAGMAQLWIPTSRIFRPRAAGIPVRGTLTQGRYPGRKRHRLARIGGRGLPPPAPDRPARTGAVRGRAPARSRFG